MADLMIVNPQWTLGQIAKELGVTRPWLSTVKNSDCFIDYWRIRSAAHSKAVTVGVKEKIAGATEMALDNLQEKMEELIDTNALGVDQSLQVLSTLNKYGYGQTAKDAPTINFNIGLVSPELLAKARQKLRREDSTPALELEAEPVKEAG